MKNIYVFIIILFSLTGFTFAQENASRVVLNLTSGDSVRTLSFGIDRRATNGIDTALGEKAEFPLPPPKSFWAFFYAGHDPVFGGENGRTFRVIRPFPQDFSKPVIDTLEIYGITISTGLKFDWTSLSNEIDSAFITDNTGFDLIKIDMKQNTSSLIHPTLSHQVFFIKTWYNKTLLSIFESNLALITDSFIKIIGNQASDEIKVTSQEENVKYAIYSFIGEEIGSGNLQSGENMLDINFLAGGVYFISFVTQDGKRELGKIIKI